MSGPKDNPRDLPDVRDRLPHDDDGYDPDLGNRDLPELRRDSKFNLDEPGEDELALEIAEAEAEQENDEN
jgi:hypothetical protein